MNNIKMLKLTLPKPVSRYYILSNVSIKPTALRRFREGPVSSLEPESSLDDSLII